METKLKRPLLRYHGGKWRLARWIVAQMPGHTRYVEPFGGGASVLLVKPRCFAEIYNDLDGEIVNLFTMVRDRGRELKEAVRLTPYARAEFELSRTPAQCPLEQARRTLVRSYFGHGGNMTALTRAGELERTAFRSYSGKGRRSTPCGDWTNYPDAMDALIARLRGVIIEQKDAVAVMLAHDSNETLHYVDPPYLWETRTRRARGYRHEMTDAQHEELLAALRFIRGPVILSGYANPLYSQRLGGWRQVKTATTAEGAAPRTETLFCNF